MSAYPVVGVPAVQRERLLEPEICERLTRRGIDPEPIVNRAIEKAQLLLGSFESLLEDGYYQALWAATRKPVELTDYLAMVADASLITRPEALAALGLPPDPQPTTG
jgi:hypothetical protein